MELNQLPEGYNEAELGPQKRRTKFDSPKAKLAYDAQNLIRIAKEQSKRMGVIVDPVTLARREDDDIEVLRAAIVKEQQVIGDITGDTVDSASAAEAELSPEQAWLNAFKTRFDALPRLHQGVQWPEVEQSLKADPEAMRKLRVLDEAGFEMNVFGEKNGEIQFRTAQTDVTKIASRYRTIMYDKQAQTDYPQYNVNGNAEDIATGLGVELANPELYEQFRVQRGWVWLKTDPATRGAGDAIYGVDGGLYRNFAHAHNDYGSFCAALRVKKT